MERLLDVEDVAALLRLAPRTIYNLAERRALPVQRVGRRLRFSPSAIERWLAQQARDDRATFQGKLRRRWSEGTRRGGTAHEQPSKDES